MSASQPAGQGDRHDDGVSRGLVQAAPLYYSDMGANSANCRVLYRVAARAVCLRQFGARGVNEHCTARGMRAQSARRALRLMAVLAA